MLLANGWWVVSGWLANDRKVISERSLAGMVGFWLVWVSNKFIPSLVLKILYSPAELFPEVEIFGRQLEVTKVACSLALGS